MGISTGQPKESTPQDVYDRIINLYKSHTEIATQKDIGEDLGFDKSTVNKWKSRFPGVDVLMKISQRFNVSLDWLVYGDNDNGEKMDTVQATYNALTALSEVSRIKIKSEPMAELPKENQYFYEPYKINIEITPKVYTKMDEWDEVRHYMSIEYYKFAWFIRDWYGIYKASISPTNKKITFDDLFHKVCNYQYYGAHFGIDTKKDRQILSTMCDIPYIELDNADDYIELPTGRTIDFTL